jgi:hypothetical protein
MGTRTSVNGTTTAAAQSCGLLALLLLGAVSATCQPVNLSYAATAVPRPGTYVVVDTGQTKCYDNRGEIASPKPGQPFYGQDAQFQAYQFRLIPLFQPRKPADTPVQ